MWSARWLWVVLAFVGGIAAARVLIDLDRVVTTRFDGQRFAVPSKVLTAPTIVYPGLDWQQIGLRESLLRLGYREHERSGPLPLAHFRWRDDRVWVHLRAFDHPSRPEPERDILIRLRGSQIDEMLELPDQRPVGAILIEPELVGAYYGLDREQRELVRMGDVPRHLVDAILSVEDRRFVEHPGVDLRRILGAFVANLRPGGFTQGGSTITQQLVKNFFLTPEKTLSRKIQEAVMALLVEARYDKDEILEAYLNEIYLGQRGATAIHGVGEASLLYFGKPVDDLTAAESATVAAIIQSPNRLSPHRHPERAVERRNLVLDLMRKQGRIDEEVHARALAEPLRVAAAGRERGGARYFLDLLRRQLPEVYDEEMLSAEGLKIYSTLDPRLQRAAATALVEGLDEIEGRGSESSDDDPPHELQGCIVAVRPQTGEILALVGGRDYGESQFDRCSQAKRQAGSVFKPFVYIAALEPFRGEPAITLADFLDDSPLEVDLPSGVWAPENYDKEFRGRVSIRKAVEGSLNVPAARLGMEIGVERVIGVARRLGIVSELPRVPSLSLGTAEVTPLEIASAYATLAAGGVRPTLHTFEDVVSSQSTLERRRLEFERVLDPGTAYLATSLLEGVVDRGTGSRLRSLGFTGPIAGKTGTTDDEYDLWFVGYTPELVAVVWIGYDEPRAVGVPSSRGALPIWARFMRASVGAEVRGAFLPPPEVERFEIDPSSGALALSGCPDHRTEFFLEGTQPLETCPAGGRNAEDGGLMRWLRDLL